MILGRFVRRLRPSIGEQSNGGMQSAFDGAKWNAQHFRNVLIAEALKVRHEQNLAVQFRKSVNNFLDPRGFFTR